jgi:spore coat protein U-like protein
MRRLVVAALLALLPVAARAQCTVSAAPVGFGVYQPFAASPTDSTGSVRVVCSSLLAGYTVALGPGGGSIAARRMTSGAGTLPYQLYTSAARSTVWGDGSGGSATIGGTCLLSCDRTITIYGRIPARQVVRPGSYLDTITAIVTF